MSVEPTKWTIAYGENYWDSHTREECRLKVLRKWDTFRADRFLPSGELDVVLDVGGGKYGGALEFVRARRRVLVDLLPEDSLQLPEGVEFFRSDFSCIDMPDGIASVIICLEALDHASSMNHFRKAQSEMFRLMCVGGLLLFEMPLRRSPRDGHPVAPGIGEVLRGFSDLKILFRRDRLPSVGSGKRMCLVARKEK